MAEFYVDPGSPTNGTGTELDPKNTFIGMTWASNNRYKLKRGAVLKEAILPTGAVNNAYLEAYGSDGPWATVDCEGTRTYGLDLNSKIGWDVSGLRIINQNSAVTQAGIRVSGSKHKVHDNLFENNQASIHVNNSADNQIYDNVLDVGNPNTPSIAYGIRLNAAGAVRNLVRNNKLRSTARGMTFISTIQVFTASGNFIIGNDVAVPKGDGPSLRSGSAGNYMIANWVHGNNIKDGLVCEGSSGNFIWNNLVDHDAGEGSTFPAFKMGDEFGAGTPSDNNSVRNNIFIARAGLCMSLVTIGVNNTFRNNVYWKDPALQFPTTIVNLNTGGGTSSYTYDDWIALGYDVDSVLQNPELTDEFKLPAGSDLIGSGIFVGYIKDALGSAYWNPPSPGPFEYERPRVART